MISYLCPRRKLDIVKVSHVQIICDGKTVKLLNKDIVSI